LHCPTKDRIWRNQVSEITNENGEQVSNFNQIKEVSFRNFEKIYKEDNKINLDFFENMLNEIPLLIGPDENMNLCQLITKEKVWGVISQMNPD
jgi:hypothetical protein